MKTDQAMLFMVAGLAIGALAVYIYLTTTMSTQIVEITRDEKGHVVGIIEKRL